MSHLAEKFWLLVRYYASTGLAYVLELSLLWCFSYLLGWPYLLAVPAAFSIAATINYVGCHIWVFARSRRKLPTEYSYFMAVLTTGLLLTTALVTSIEYIHPINVVYARLIAGVFTGLWNFYLNARYNFRARAFTH